MSEALLVPQSGSEPAYLFIRKGKVGFWGSLGAPAGVRGRVAAPPPPGRFCRYWEVGELVRKLCLTGFVFLIPPSLTLVRLLVAMLITFGHVVLLQRATRPCPRSRTRR